MKLLTVREACRHLRISRATFYNLVKKGDLSIVKIGGKTLIKEDVVKRLIARGTRTSARRVPRPQRRGWTASWESTLRRSPRDPSGPRPFYAPKDVESKPRKAGPRPAAPTEEENFEDR